MWRGLRSIDQWISTYLFHDSSYFEIPHALMLRTPYLRGNNPLEHEWIVVCSATRNTVPCWKEVTMNNGDPTTIISPKMIHIPSVVGQIAVVYLLMWRLGNGDVSNWWTNLKRRSDAQIRVMILDSGSTIHIKIIERSGMISEHTCNTKGVTPISKLASSQSRSASVSSLDDGLQVYLHLWSIAAFKCMSKLTASWPWSVSVS